MTTHFHIFKTEENNKLKLTLDVEMFGKNFSFSKLFKTGAKPELKVYGFSIIFDKFIIQFGDEMSSKMITMPWRSSVDYQVKFMGRDGRMVTVQDEDVLKSGGLAQRLLAENLYIFKDVVGENKSDKIQLRYITFELTTSVGRGVFSWLRKILPKNHLNVVLIQKYVNGELVDDGYHILKESVERKISKYMKHNKLSEM